MRFLIFLIIIHGALAAPLGDDEALEEFTEGNHKFTSAVYKELAKEKTGNIIVSPLSTETVLALAYEGASGETASELIKGLFLPSTEEKIQAAFKSLTPQFQTSQDDLKLLSANKVYIGEDIELEDSFKSVAADVYGSGVENVDFSANVAAAKEINDWVEENTNHKIQNLIDPNGIAADTKMILVNTLYFYGKWESMFEEHGTKKRDFHKSKEETVQVDTMTQTANLNYYESSELDARFLELSYKDADITMVIALPNDVEGLESLEENIGEVLQAQPFSSQYLQVRLPKFVIETQISFVPILRNLGIQRVFDESADLSRLSSTGNSLYISDVTQKAYINITEGGTEAAGGSGGVIPQPIPGPGLDPILFSADHPFLYVIKYNEIITFIGRYVEPTE